MDVNLLADQTIERELSLPSLGASLDEVYRDGHPFVSIQQFIEDDYYLGKIGKDIYAENKPDLIDIFNPEKNYAEVILTGAVGIGKTFLACIALSYMIGQLGHYINPHHWVNASPASPIFFINMSINATKAKSVVFNRTKNMIDRSPYFNRVFQRDKRLSDKLVWRVDQDRITERTGAAIELVPGTGDSLSILGDDVYGGVLDELNFFRIVEKSKKVRGELLDPAQRIYDTVLRRMISRFSEGGALLGKLFLISSSQYPDDFIERRIDEAEEDGSLGKTVKVIRGALWERKASVFMGQDRFRVEVGTSHQNSRLLDTYNKKTDIVEQRIEGPIEGKVLMVPVGLYDEFYRDLDGAIRDFGGEVTRAISPFFPDSMTLWKAVELGEKEGLSHPWSLEQPTLKDGSHLLVETIFEKQVDSSGHETGRYTPRRHPRQTRYAHVDLGVTGDAAGLGIVHIAGWRQVLNIHGEYEDKPIYETDLLLRIIPPPSGEGIRISQVRAIFPLLRRHGMHFGTITYDGFQSTESIQELKVGGFSSGLLSVDKDPVAYTVTKDAFYEHRMILYLYTPVMEELSRLEKRGDTIDHPPTGSKDCSDGLGGAIYNAFLASLSASPEIIKSRLPIVGKSDEVHTLKKAKIAAENEFRKEAKAQKILRPGDLGFITRAQKRDKGVELPTGIESTKTYRRGKENE